MKVGNSLVFYLKSRRTFMCIQLSVRSLISQTVAVLELKQSQLTWRWQININNHRMFANRWKACYSCWIISMTSIFNYFNFITKHIHGRHVLVINTSVMWLIRYHRLLSLWFVKEFRRDFLPTIFVMHWFVLGCVGVGVGWRCTKTTDPFNVGDTFVTIHCIIRIVEHYLSFIFNKI